MIVELTVDVDERREKRSEGWSIRGLIKRKHDEDSLSMHDHHIC